MCALRFADRRQTPRNSFSGGSRTQTGGVFSRPEGPSGEGTGGVSPPVGGGSGGLPRENFEKMMQNGAIWSVIKAF